MVVSYAPKTYMANILDQRHFDFDFDGVLGQVWYLIVAIPDLCKLTYSEAKYYNQFEWNIILIPKVEILDGRQLGF